MKDDRFNSLVQQRFGCPLAPFSMLRLARALRQAIEGCGEAGDAALKARGKEQDKLDCIKSVKRSRMKRRGKRASTDYFRDTTDAIGVGGKLK